VVALPWCNLVRLAAENLGSIRRKADQLHTRLQPFDLNPHPNFVVML
jgi:hypothetical protein